MQAINRQTGHLLCCYEYENKSLFLKTVDLFLIFTVTFPIQGKVYTFNTQERVFTERKWGLFESDNPAIRVFEVFCRVVCGVGTVYLAATSLPFLALLSASLLIKLCSSENKHIHRKFLKGCRQMRQIEEPPPPKLPIYSNRVYRIDGQVVAEMPDTYYKKLNQIIRNSGYKKEHKQDKYETIDYTVTCAIDGHVAELQYSMTKTQRVDRIRLKNEEYKSSKYVVDQVASESVPAQYLATINALIERHIDAEMIDLEKQMKEGLAFFKITWATGSILFEKQDKGYLSTLETHIGGHQIVITRNHSPATFSVFNS